MTTKVTVANADSGKIIRVRVQGLNSVYAAAWVDIPPGQIADFHVHTGVQIEVQEGADYIAPPAPEEPAEPETTAPAPAARKKKAAKKSTEE